MLVSTKVCLSRQNCFSRRILCLSRQNYIRYDKHVFTATNQFCRDKSFVATSILFIAHFLPRQKYACRDQIKFVETNICCDKILLSRQTYFCHDRHIFVLSRQKLYFWQLPPMIVFWGSHRGARAYSSLCSPMIPSLDT